MFLIVTALVLQTRVGSAALRVDVATDRRAYRLRQPVRITVTETNAGDRPETVSTGCRILSAYARRHGTVVWAFRDPRLCATGQGALGPGASRTFDIVWSGRTARNATGRAPGVHVVHAEIDAASGSATVRFRRHAP